MYSYLCRLRCSKRRRPSLKINLGHNWKNRVNMCTAPVLRTGLLLPENRTLRSHSTRQPGLLVPVQKELLEGSRRIDTITRIRLYLYQQSWNYPYLLLGWVLRRSILMKPHVKATQRNTQNGLNTPVVADTDNHTVVAPMRHTTSHVNGRGEKKYLRSYLLRTPTCICRLLLYSRASPSSWS